MVKTTKNQRKKCAKPTLYETPRGDFMADMGDGRIVPVAGKLALHNIPEEFLDLATVYEPPVYQLQFIGSGTSMDIYARSIEELFGAFALVRDNYIVENGNQEVRFYQFAKGDGWRSLGGLYGADIEREGLRFGEFKTLLEEANNE